MATLWFAEIDSRAAKIQLLLGRNGAVGLHLMGAA
jgi:hypothetical protein